MNVKSLIELLFFSDKWNIGFVRQSKEDFLERKYLLGISWLEEEKSNHSADPFVIDIDDTTYVYYEFLNFWQGTGIIFRINQFDFTTREQVQISPVQNIHVSYPYIFKDNNKTYCIPETAEANEVSLYDLDPENSGRFIKNKTLISGAPYVDSSIIKFQDRYWLFTSRLDKPGAYFIYFSESLNDTFIAHALNPIRADLRSYRSAGHLFIVDGILYRPSQNLEKSYGGSIIINRITKLSGTDFESNYFFEVLPRSPYHEGIHTISFENNLILIDGKRNIFSLTVFIKKVRKKVMYLIRRSMR